MDTAHAKRIIAVLFAAITLSCHAQVFSQHIYGGGRIYEHQWLIVSPPNYYGFTQYREYQDSNGMVLLSSEQYRTVRTPTYTQIDLGRFQFTVRMPAWMVATTGVVLFALLILLADFARGRLKALRRDEEHVA